MDERERKAQWLACSLSPAYFADRYVRIYNASVKAWIPFALWPAQLGVMNDLQQNQYVVMLKARQLGMSWLCLTYALWLMLFRPAATVLIMSKRDDEAVELLQERLAKMYWELPAWMQAKVVVRESAHDFVLSNGSRAKAFPTSGGRSYTASFVLLDEADFLPDLAGTLNALRPTVDAGGQLVMISTVDKALPQSPFKEIFRSAWYQGEGQYKPIFLPWYTRPERTRAWYDAIALDMFKQTNSSDNLWQEYPETVEQALAPLQLAKRIPFAWLEACQEKEAKAVTGGGAPAVPGLVVWRRPQDGHLYVIGADPAEGNPTSDDSAATVLDADTWEEVASFRGKWEPEIFAGYIDQVAQWYRRAAVMPERNNHGHALILALQTSGRTQILVGTDDKPGWLSTTRGKTILYDLAAQVFHDGDTVVRTPQTVAQLAAIEADTLRAPEGLMDDLADSYALALAGCRWKYVAGVPATTAERVDRLSEIDERGEW
ncbi:MAG: hypothetical protein M9936_31990 [Caldilinea sp.]|nr:hypothetical protein [Caldilinea sp.]